MPYLTELLVKEFSGAPYNSRISAEIGYTAERLMQKYTGVQWSFEVDFDSVRGSVKIFPPNIPASDQRHYDQLLADNHREEQQINQDQESPVEYDLHQGPSEPAAVDSAAQLTKLFQGVLEVMPGVNSEDEGLQETPKRVAQAYLKDFLRGYQEDPKEILKTFNGESYDEVVLVKDIPYYSLCEHHLVPFFGVAHVGYIPADRIVGLSKLPRLVDCFSRRLQVQERLTRQIAEALDECLKPKGVMVVITGRHMCMEARGIRKAGSSTTTSAVLGVFKDPEKGARAEFLQLIRE